MRKEMLRYYKRQIYGGRSGLARILDIVVLRIVVFAAAFMFALYNTRNLTASVLIAFFLTIALSVALLLKRKRKESKFFAQDLENTKKKCLLESLTLMQNEAFIRFVYRLFDNGINATQTFDGGFTGEFDGRCFIALQNHPDHTLSVQDVLFVFRMTNQTKPILLFSLAKPSEDAKNMIDRIPQKVEICCGGDVLERAEERDMLPSEEEAMARAEAEMEKTRNTIKNIKSYAIKKAKTKGYLICGAVSLVWPLFSGFRFYHPIIALICFALAYFSSKSSNIEQDQDDKAIS